jgi:predicted nucleic acid-binding protein
MSADRAREFVDANVLVYAYDPSAAGKHEQARTLIERLWTDGTGCLSVQVLQEFFVTVTRKVPKPLNVETAELRVRELCAWRVFAPRAEDVLAAIAVQRRSKLSFWDAMIVEAARQLECGTLWTEDLTHGQRLHDVTVANPFRQG